MFRREAVLTATLSVLIGLASTVLAQAESVKVLPFLSVTKHTYNVPLNEQPFYGFMPKNEVMLAADRKFVDAVEKNSGREAGAEQFDAMGWSAVQNGDLAVAAKRFNQAWLLDAGRSSTVHGMAIVVSERFGDLDYAIELATAAAGLKFPLPSLAGDQGGLLLKAGKPDRAIPLLEKASAALPDWVNPQINLASAKFDMGDVREACRYLSKVERLLQEHTTGRSPKIETLYRSLGEKAHCTSL